MYHPRLASLCPVLYLNSCALAVNPNLRASTRIGAQSLHCYIGQFLLLEVLKYFKNICMQLKSLSPLACPIKKK